MYYPWRILLMSNVHQHLVTLPFNPTPIPMFLGVCVSRSVLVNVVFWELFLCNCIWMLYWDDHFIIISNIVHLQKSIKSKWNDVVLACLVHIYDQGLISKSKLGFNICVLIDHFNTCLQVLSNDLNFTFFIFISAS